MNVNAGIWIDHREAIIVRSSENSEQVIRLASDAESQLRRSSDRSDGGFEAQQVPADDTRNRKFMAELNTFYDDVISHLKSVDSIYICGPGEARTELKKRLEAKHPVSCEVQLEPADKMTEAQVVAKIRAHFQAAAS